MSRIFLIAVKSFIVVLLVTPTPTFITQQTEQSEPWYEIMPGIEQRRYFPNNSLLGQIMAFRIDPAQFDFRLFYETDVVRSTTEWLDHLPDDIVFFVNATFFDRARQPMGLLIIEDTIVANTRLSASGFVYQSDSEMGVTSDVIEFNMLSNLEFVFEGTPMLISNGASVYFNPSSERVARRTVIAEDADGNILLLVTPLIGLRLPDLTDFLVQSDLGIVDALNLDGGRSTTLVVPSEDYRISAFDRIPVVLSVMPK